MTALWIIGGIVLLIVLLMMISVTVYVKIDETVRIKVGALGIRFTVFPASRKKEKPPKTKKRKKEKPAKPQKPMPEKRRMSARLGILFHVRFLFYRRLYRVR